MAKVTIDGKEYEYDSLSDVAKQQVQSLSACDQKIAQLNNDLAITRTARTAYAQALAKELAKG